MKPHPLSKPAAIALFVLALLFTLLPLRILAAPIPITDRTDRDLPFPQLPPLLDEPEDGDTADDGAQRNVDAATFAEPPILSADRSVLNGLLSVLRHTDQRVQSSSPRTKTSALLAAA